MNKTTNAQAANKETEVVAAIVSAIVAMGYSQNQIASIRPVVSNAWRGNSGGSYNEKVQCYSKRYSL